MNRLVFLMVTLMVATSFSSCMVNANIPIERKVAGKNKYLATYRNGWVFDLKGKIIANYANGFIFSAEKKVCATYSNGFVLDLKGKIVATYRNGFIFNYEQY